MATDYEKSRKYAAGAVAGSPKALPGNGKEDDAGNTKPAPENA